MQGLFVGLPNGGHNFSLPVARPGFIASLSGLRGLNSNQQKKKKVNLAASMGQSARSQIFLHNW